MTKAEIRKLIGKAVVVRWRDPQSYSGWTSTPLVLESAQVETLGRVVGLNNIGEAVFAATRHGGGDVSDLNAIPLACIEGIKKIPMQ